MTTTLERFWAKVDKTGDCWAWTAFVAKSGYASFSVAGEHAYAHRFSYELLRGPIPPGLQIDHLCRNKVCVNPDHLDAVTPAENVRRAAAYVTHCPGGHPYDESNTHRRTRGSRDCLACARDRMRRLRAERKAAGIPRPDARKAVSA